MKLKHPSADRGNVRKCRRPDVCPAEERAALELLEGCLRKFNKAGLDVRIVKHQVAAF